MEEERPGRCTCSGNLFEAAEKGCEDCCRRMIGQAGKTRDDVQLDGLQGRKSRTALMVAAFYGNAECVQLLAEKEAGMQDEDNHTALMCAAEQGHIECVKILAPLEKAMKNEYGLTALMFAAEYGHPECVKILAPLEKGMQ